MQSKSLFANGQLAWKLIQYPILAEPTGNLGVVELGKEFNFNIKRAFFLRNVQSDQIRGKHSHKELKQLVICLSGSYSIALDNGETVETLQMDETNQCLFLDGKVWREMSKFSDNAVMLVLCDREYRYDEVIRDYSQFKQILNENFK